MGRRRSRADSPYGYDIEVWQGPLGPFYRIPTEKELAARRADEAKARTLLARRFGPDSDIAQMLGLTADSALGVAA